MKAPEFLKVTPEDIAHVGVLGACILAAVRYMTALSAESNGRRLIDGQVWWRASATDIAEALGGGCVASRTVSRTVRDMLETGHLVAVPTQDFFGDRARAYRAPECAPDLPLARSDIRSDLPSANTADRSANLADDVGQIRHTTSAILADLPSTEELKEPHYVGENARDAQPIDAETLPALRAAPTNNPRGTRLPEGWMPDPDTVAAMRSAHPHVDLRAEHDAFTDYWRSKAGAGARKVDWAATWRNWIRREAKSRRPHADHHGGLATSDLRVAQVQALKETAGPLELETGNGLTA